MELRPLDAAGRHSLAEALEHTPWTATTTHLLHRDLCTAYVEGDASSFAAAIVFWDFRPDTAVAYGPDIEALWRLLQTVQGWRAVNVAETHAQALAAMMEHDLGRPVQLCGDVYFVLTGPPREFSHTLVRRLMIGDTGLIEKAPPQLQQGRLFGGPLGLLREGIIAGAIDGGKLVATAHTSMIAGGYADIGVATLEAYRRQGIATAAASLVCREAQAIGHIPVWNCAEDNLASLRLAAKLGFLPAGKRVDLAPDEEQELDLIGMLDAGAVHDTL